MVSLNPFLIIVGFGNLIEGSCIQTDVLLGAGVVPTNSLIVRHNIILIVQYAVCYLNAMLLVIGGDCGFDVRFHSTDRLRLTMGNSNDISHFTLSFVYTPYLLQTFLQMI